MATFTTQSKTPLSWTAPPPVEVVGDAYELLISDDYKLDIGGGFYLTIKPEAVDIFWTTTDKNTGSNHWPSPTVTTPFLDIGDGFNLLVATGYKLQIGDDAVTETPWTNESKNSPAHY